MLLPVKNMSGEQVGEIEVSDAVFGAPVNQPLMHQALLRQLSNARLGTHKTKTRSEVRGGGRKPWRQKGTGRARQGSIRAPQWIGGGTVFGPRPRKYTKQMPKKMRRAALRSALSVKAGAEQIVVVDRIEIEQPKTKVVVEMLNALGASGSSVLLVLNEAQQTVQRSANNLPKVKTILSGYVNVRDLLGHDVVILTREIVEELELWLLSANAERVLAGQVELSSEEADDGTVDAAIVNVAVFDEIAHDTTARSAANDATMETGA